MGISPFFRAALPTLSSLRSPTQTLGYMHGYSGIKPPENLTRLAVHVSPTFSKADRGKSEADINLKAEREHV